MLFAGKLLPWSVRKLVKYLEKKGLKCAVWDNCLSCPVVELEPIPEERDTVIYCRHIKFNERAKVSRISEYDGKIPYWCPASNLANVVEYEWYMLREKD